jgi:hypothetical protein
MTTTGSRGAAAESSPLRESLCENLVQAVIPSPSLVILSGAKNLALPLRVNSAKSLS